MNNKFKILMTSDIEYEDLCAEIYYEDQFVAIVNQEKGYDNLEIEIHPPKDKAYWTFNFGEFMYYLEDAKKALWEMRKLPE